jgi:hypothetical protein
MTGAPAETWRRFSFSNAPQYSWWVGGLLSSATTARRASGYLPLTRGSAQSLRTTTWGIAGLVPLGFVFWIFAAIVPPAPFGFLFLLLGVAAFIVGVVGLLIVRRTYGPLGKLLEPQPGHAESLIELRNVHPAFVAAVQQVQRDRAESARSK